MRTLFLLAVLLFFGLVGAFQVRDRGKAAVMVHTVIGAVVGLAFWVALLELGLLPFTKR